MLACLLIATAGELFLALAWGLYSYREAGLPLFVPPGHVLLYMLGLASPSACLRAWYARSELSRRSPPRGCG